MSNFTHTAALKAKQAFVSADRKRKERKQMDMVLAAFLLLMLLLCIALCAMQENRPVNTNWAYVNQSRPVMQSSSSVDPNRLAKFVNGILNKYRTDGMFSLAVRIPDNQNQNPEQILRQVFDSDPGNTVKDTINSNQVYIGNRVVAAKALQWPSGAADHAESRVVDHLDHLFNRPKNNDLLLFYVYALPCVEKCLNYTHHENILQSIQIIRQLKNHVFVFQKPFRPSNGELIYTEQQWIEALQRLGNAIGQENIFRYDWGRCTRCFIGGQVDPRCFRDN